MTARIDICREDPTSPDARALIDELNATMLDIYPPEHCHHMPAETLASSGACFLIARSGEKVLGCGAGVPLDTDRVELKRFFTRPAARRSGASRAILSRVESWARAEGYSKLVLETGARSDAAIALYTSHGFAPCDAFGEYRATEDNVFYEKSIAGETAGSDKIG